MTNELFTAIMFFVGIGVGILISHICDHWQKQDGQNDG